MEPGWTQIEPMLPELVAGQAIKPYYTAEEFARLVGREPFTCLLDGLAGRDDRPVPGDLGLEVAEADPLQALAQIHLSDRDGAPALGLGDAAADVVEAPAHHPLPG